jgi:hypothetical protein
MFEQVKSLVEEQASCTLGATTSAIVLAASIIFLLEHLLNEEGQGPVEVFNGDKLHQVMDKFLALSFPNVQNLIVSFKHRPGNRRYVFSILALKVNSGYYYI